MYELVTTPRRAAFPPGHGRFNVDDRHAEEAVDEDDDDPQPEMFARATSIFHSQSHQQRFREQRQLRGHASTALEIGKFVAYMPDYTADTPPEMRQDFWVGDIIELGPDTGQLRVRRFHTNPINNLDNPRAAYRVWQGEGPKNEWIQNARVLEQFKLTDKGKLIEARMRGLIKNAIALHKACISDAVPDIAVGMDLLENPNPIRGFGHLSDSDEDNGANNEDDDEDDFD